MSDPQTINVRPPVWALLAAVVIGGFFYLGGKRMESRDPGPSVITVSGEGKMNAAPDIAELRFGVRIDRAPTSQEAMQALTREMNAVMQAVRAEGVEERDIQTAQFSLNPSYDWNEGTQTLRGYDASQMLVVKVRDLAKTSAVLGAAAEAGANQAGDVQFTIDEPEELRAQAREEAIADAQAKAEVLAEQLDVRIVRLKGFAESGGGYMPPVIYGRGGADMAMAEAAPPLPAGEQELTVQVTLTYEID